MWYSLEVPHRGTSNECNNMFSWRNKKTVDTFFFKKKDPYQFFCTKKKRKENDIRNYSHLFRSANSTAVC